MNLPIGGERRGYVQAMFGRIAGRYDLMNALMTAGMDGYWRAVATREAVSNRPTRVLDVGTGTARLASAIAAADARLRVVGADLTLPMLQVGRATLDTTRVSLVAADALALPFPDSTFDTVTSAFTVRNLASLEAGFREQYRVLRPGGRLVCLELTMPASRVASAAFSLYFERIVPLLGDLMAGDRSAYTYLPASVAAFPPPAELAAIIGAVGFERVRWRRLHPGTVSLHVATRPR